MTSIKVETSIPPVLVTVEDPRVCDELCRMRFRFPTDVELEHYYDDRMRLTETGVLIDRLVVLFEGIVTEYEDGETVLAHARTVQSAVNDQGLRQLPLGALETVAPRLFKAIFGSNGGDISMDPYLSRLLRFRGGADSLISTALERRGSVARLFDRASEETIAQLRVLSGTCRPEHPYFVEEALKAA